MEQDNLYCKLLEEGDEFMDEVHRMCFGDENHFEEELDKMIANGQVEPPEEISDELEVLLSQNVNESEPETQQEQSSVDTSSSNLAEDVESSKTGAEAVGSPKKLTNESKPFEPSGETLPVSRAQVESKRCVRHVQDSKTSTMGVQLQRRYHAYRVAAYQANQIGDRPWAFRLLGRAHKVAAFKEALEKGQKLDARRIPPPPKLNPLMVDTVQTGNKCSPALLLGLKLSITQSDVERLEIYKQILEEQRMEASLLASQQKLIGLKAQAEELEQLGHHCETVLHALGSVDLACVHANAQFYAVKLLVPNRTPACKENQLQIAVSWFITNCNVDSPGPWMTTFVEVELPCPGEVKQFRTNESVVFGNISQGRHVGMFRINTASWYHTRCVKLSVKVYCRVQIADGSSEQLIDSHVISMLDLEDSATMVFSNVLKGKKGVLEVTVSQYRPLNGSALTILTKPWLSLTVEPADQTEGKPTNTQDQIGASMAGPASCKFKGKPNKNDSSSSHPTLKQQNDTEPTENSVKLSLELTVPAIELTPVSAGPTSVPSGYTPSSPKVIDKERQNNNIPRSTPNLESLNVENTNKIGQLTYTRSPLGTDSDETAAGRSNFRRNPVLQHRLTESMTELPRSSRINVSKQALVSRQLLKDQEQMHLIRSSDPGSLESVRLQHQRDLAVIQHQIRQLDERLSGPNARIEMMRYVSGLEQLKLNLEATCKQAKRVNNLPYLAGEQHKLDVVTNELKMIRSKL
ncbi:hypothetical protein P879_09031 [Paragonimus westermani]|uniref:Uncharacterized protein n=1 Tax=Paragonimus westermani TaxID=34504 RepID=A0A8T0DHE8_9TREM|nr:hypothetical protein P879_09031 [Paragonimus westermani]